MGRRINIGTSSLVLIFIVLCLATFGLLSLSNAKGDWNLANKNAEAVRNYYQADAEGVAFYREMSQRLKKTDAALSLETEFGEFYSPDSGLLQTDIAMNYGQALHIELEVMSDRSCQIRSWKVYNRENYEIDDSIPVWTG